MWIWDGVYLSLIRAILTKVPIKAITIVCKSSRLMETTAPLTRVFLSAVSTPADARESAARRGS